MTNEILKVSGRISFTKVRVVSSESLKQQFLLFVCIIEFIIINDTVYIYIVYVCIRIYYNKTYL